MQPHALEALDVYRTHKYCCCEYCVYARDVLAAMDRERTIGAVPRPEGPGAERNAADDDGR
jgi:hypothetical protein